MAQQWNTIHIFSYGETQAIGSDYNKKTSTAGVTGAQAVIDNVYSFKPQSNDASTDYRAVNIFEGMFADYHPKTGESFRVQFTQLDASLCQTLVDEVYAAVPNNP
jgi:hypothetical protein